MKERSLCRRPQEMFPETFKEIQSHLTKSKLILTELGVFQIEKASWSTDHLKIHEIS